jgi:putative membrane protein
MMAPPLAVIGWGGGLAIVGGLVGIAFWILLIALIVLVVRSIRPTAPASEGSAIRLLEERYARGEITHEDFLERLAMLGGQPPGAAGTDSP